MPIHFKVLEWSNNVFPDWKSATILTIKANNNRNNKIKKEYHNNYLPLNYNTFNVQISVWCSFHVLSLLVPFFSLPLSLSRLHLGYCCGLLSASGFTIKKLSGRVAVPVSHLFSSIWLQACSSLAWSWCDQRNVKNMHRHSILNGGVTTDEVTPSFKQRNVWLYGRREQANVHTHQITNTNDEHWAYAWVLDRFALYYFHTNLPEPFAVMHRRRGESNKRKSSSNRLK